MKLSELNESANPKAKKGLGLSLSKIKAWETCNYRYYLQYLMKEKFDKEDFDPKFFKIGQFAHKYIESKIKGIECKFDSTTLTDEEKTKTTDRCQSVFENDYIKSILGKGEAEKEFSLYITPTEDDGLEAHSKFIRAADFHGYIDYFAKVGNTIHVVDWKTGRIKGEDDDTFMQLYLYGKACQKLHGGSKIKLSFFYVDHAEIVSKEMSIDELDKKIETVINKGISIPTQKNAELFPSNPGNACKYCPYSKVRSSDNKVVCEFAK